jgi:2-hydroxycyclohexanecarboxyl-CoA dehydrogenase
MARTALVTGAASGMGLAISQMLGARGDRVALLDRNEAAAEQAAHALRDAGVDAVAVTVDVADRDSVDAAVATAREALGPIEIAVTAAGIGPHHHFADITRERWDEMIGINLTGTFNCIHAAITDMVAGGWGRVVTISSYAGQVGADAMADYAASKGGVIAMTKSLSAEFARHGIMVNSISPGPIATPMLQMSQDEGRFDTLARIAAMIPARRVGTPEEIAATCAFLTSEACSFVTGQIVGVNGGMG